MARFSTPPCPASGVRNIDGEESITEDTPFWIASLTKLVTSIALMQLVEQGKVDLDSADKAEDILPEIKWVKVLEGFDEKGEAILKEKKTRITLRLLNSHQSKQLQVGGDHADNSRWIFIQLPRQESLQIHRIRHGK
jgi:hypothetical protein